MKYYLQKCSFLIDFEWIDEDVIFCFDLVGFEDIISILPHDFIDIILKKRKIMV
jgi:hypothetical protein